MTGSYDTAEELVQEGFVKAIEHWDTLNTLAFQQKRAWMYQTIKHLFIDSVRKNKREFLTNEVPDNTTSFDYSEKEWMELINSLPPLEGKILLLRYVEGFTSSQIGILLKLPPGTVRSKLHDARKHLRNIL
jgi:RNA polymerase sigma-70 factor (ECF subfamily)